MSSSDSNTVTNWHSDRHSVSFENLYFQQQTENLYADNMYVDNMYVDNVYVEIVYFDIVYINNVYVDNK